MNKFMYLFFFCSIALRTLFTSSKVIYQYEDVDFNKSVNITGAYQLTAEHITDHFFKPYEHIYDIFLSSVADKNDETIITENHCGKANVSYTYQQFIERIHYLSYGLKHYEGGVKNIVFPSEKANKGNFRMVGIYAENSANWLVTDFASMISNITTVIIHSKFNTHDVVNILNETQVEWLFVNYSSLTNILKRRDNLKYLKYVIVIDDFNGSENNVYKFNTCENLEKCEENKEIECVQLDYIEKKVNKLISESNKYNFKIMKIEELIQFGRRKKKVTKRIYGKKCFVSSILYTSGTTGKPKGVMLTNKNIFYAILPLINNEMIINRTEKKYFSYLPLSHIYERINIYVALILKKPIVFSSKDMHLFSYDFYASKSDILMGVPKVFNKLYNHMAEEIKKLPLFKRIFTKMIIGLRNKTPLYLNRFIEKIVSLSKKIRNKLNPDLEIMINGGGKISPNIQKRLSILLNVPIYQGYGLTESTGSFFLQNVKDTSYNNVGGLISPLNSFKLQNWESYKIDDPNPRGELLIKGNQIFIGYFLNEKETKKAFTKDGYFKTGDIVQLNSNGSITFVDRSKSLIKLSHGEYVEVEKLNSLYSEVPFIEFCFVYGDDTMDALIAIISIDKTMFLKYVLEDNVLTDKKSIYDIKNDNFLLDDSIINLPVFVNYVKKKLNEIHEQYSLDKLNKIHNVYLTIIPWDTSNYLTYTYKIRRHKVLDDFKFFIDFVKKTKDLPGH